MFQAPVRKVYPVRELVAAARTQLERTFTDVYVEGEISNYRPAESGHLYFTLKDGSSQLRIVMWRTQARLLRFRPENGQQIIARHYFRPRLASVARRYSWQFPAIKMVTIAQFGGWNTAQQTYFADGGVFDQIYQPNQQ